MMCPECERDVTGSQCSCGWKNTALLETRHTYQGMTLCSWSTAGKQCNMLVSGDRLYCNWHVEWERRLRDAPMESEFDALCVWMQQFAPGGDYGANPGQWWDTSDETIKVLHGFGYLPGRTEKEKYAQYLEHWEVMAKEKKGIYSEKNQKLLAKGRALEVKPTLDQKR